MKIRLVPLILVLVACATVRAPESPHNNIPVVTTVTTKKDIVLSFLAVGDNLIHGAIYHDAKTGSNSYDFTPMYQYIKPYVTSADVSFVNQETILGGKAMGLSHYPQFNSPEEVASALVDTGFDLVNHATNHSLDKYELGILHSLDTWDQYEDVVVAGIHRSKEERDAIPLLERQGIRIALLAYTQQTNGIPSPQGKDYLVNRIDESLIQDDVMRAKQVSDFVMVSMHWGDEGAFKPNALQQEYAQKLCAWGVDVIIGTHPHVIQPTELMECEDHTMLVIYSLGNFLSAQNVVYNVVEGMVTWSVVFDGNTKEPTFTSVSFTPLINHFDAGFQNFRVFTWKDYSESWMNRHGLQGYQNQSLKKSALEAKIREVMGNEIQLVFE